MYKEDKDSTNFASYWYDLWMKQSKEFFDSANDNLKGLFGKKTYPDPEEHMDQIKQWLDQLRNQWQFTHLTEQQKVYENYWKWMMTLCNEATSVMLNEWIQRSRTNDPVKSVRDLYEVWLNACHEVYAKAMHSKTYQEAYGEFMNTALKFWKDSIPK